MKLARLFGLAGIGSVRRNTGRGMELFALHCTTCKARLKVTDTSAIGEIVACPKCHSMVLVEPPPGWKAGAAAIPIAAMPVEPVAPPKPIAAPRVAAAPPPVPVNSQSPPPLPARPALPKAPTTAELTSNPVSTATRVPRDGWMFAGGTLAGIAIGAALWMLVTARGTSDEPVVSATASAADVPTSASTAPATEVQRTKVETMKPVANEPVALPEKQTSPAGEPVAVKEPTTAPAEEPSPIDSPSEVALLPQEVTEQAEPPVEANPVAEVAKATPEAETPAPAPPITGPPSDALSSRLVRRMPGVAFDKVPLRQFTAFAAELAGVTIVIDRESLAAAGIKSPVVTVRATDQTLDKVLARALDDVGLTYESRDRVIVIFAK